MSSPPARRFAAPAAQPVFPDEILEEIFLRLDAAEDLARASAACTAFYRVVSERSFLRRFRCLHPTPALGLLEPIGQLDYGTRSSRRSAFHPAKPPHRSAPAARALARAADFAFSFLRAPNRWEVCDARDGRVLLYRQAKVNLMVCDPLHRRQIPLPPIPKDVASSSASRGFTSQEFDSFLEPATDHNPLSYGVICTVKNQHNIVAFRFSSATEKWRAITLDTTLIPVGTCFRFRACDRYYAHGCFFWTTGGGFMIMLNVHDMKLSVVDLPPATVENQAAIVEAGEGMIGLFGIKRLQLYYKSLQGTGWHHERMIPLPNLPCYWTIHNVAEGYLLLRATLLIVSGKDAKYQYFTLNLKTFTVEELCVSSLYIIDARLYASFVSPFSLPTI